MYIIRLHTYSTCTAKIYGVNLWNRFTKKINNYNTDSIKMSDNQFVSFALHIVFADFHALSTEAIVLKLKT